MTLAEMLTARRSHVGLSQAQVAEAAGVSRATIATWEAGSAEPGSAPLARVLTALAVLDPVERNRYHDAPRGARAAT